MSHVRVMEALQFAHKLCAETTAFVHLYETNTVTSGEVVMEIKNCQVGMGNLHSTLACSAAVAAAVMACINPEQSGKVRRGGGGGGVRGGQGFGEGGEEG